MRRLGQHFLKTDGPVHKMVAALELRTGETVFEIGPGHGELTAALLAEVKAQNGKLIAIERDPELAEALALRFEGEKCFILLRGDALKLISEATTGQKGDYALAGNIPYYITGHLLRILGDLTHRPRKAALMVQEEVAERLAAVPPRMNRLAASVQFWAKTSILTRVPRTAFNPPPHVDSAIVILESLPELPIARDKFEKILGAAFQQPRKTILNNLKALFPGPELTDMLTDLGIPPSARPQNLSLSNLISLARKV